MDNTRHRGSVALVTGAASGIGRATAARLAQEGARVVATDVGSEGLDSLVAEQGGITAVVGDLTSAEFITGLVEEAESVGPVSIVANVAGIMDHFVPVTELDDELWSRVFDVNVTAQMRICRAIIPRMTTRGGGAIVNVASVAGLGGGGAGASYTASKHAAIGLTRHIAFTYGPQGIRCNVVCPGPVQTNIGTTAAPTVPWAFERHMLAISLGERRAQPDEIATAISWLASAEASNINGLVMAADGGWKAA
jgi:NAD(P)-dependent dehydrogenase (short-subunit alcohol dehydrogenase family)